MKFRNLFSEKFLLLVTLCTILFAACDNDKDPIEPPIVPPGPDTTGYAKWSVLKEFTLDELKEVSKGLTSVNIMVDKPNYSGTTQVMALKVSCKSGHPDGSNKKVDLSGVILMPPSVDSSQMHRVVVAPPYTYVLNRQAPTNQLKDYSPKRLEAYMSFWLLQAFKGYIVLIPDYPGFGDSHGQCFVPYTDSKAMVRTTKDWIKATQIALKQNYFKQKEDWIISGYSLGGFVAASLARDFETNTDKSPPVKLLFTGGTPCRLKQISDLVRGSEELATPYLMPYAIWGYKKNRYPEIQVSDLLKEPYASESDVYFDGLHEGIGGLFPKRVSELFTQKYIQDTNQANQRINEILEENSLKSWNNTCKFIMIHGISDRTVYYENAKDYSTEHTKNGGSVKFENTLGDHSGGGIFYFIRLMSILPDYK